MSKDPTKDLDGNRAFEERVFARFDAVDAYLRNLESRVEVVESRSYDTKPIWERALKEILESRLELGEVKAEVLGVKTKLTEVDADLTEIKRELKREIANRLDRIQSIQLNNRVDIRDLEDRFEKVESRQP